MSNIVALMEAQSVFERKDQMDRQTLFDAAVSLGEWGIFSNRSITKITGLRPRDVAVLTPKSERTGGRFEPEVLPDLISLARTGERGEMDVFTAKRVLDHCSSYYASRLSGIARSNLVRWAEKAALMEAV